MKEAFESLLFTIHHISQDHKARPEVYNMGACLGSQINSKFETLVISMEVVISVSEVELEEFPEEYIPESSGKEEQPGETSHTQGTVKSLLSIDTLPTLELLEKIKRGRIACLIQDTPEGGSNRRFQTYKAAK